MNHPTDKGARVVWLVWAVAALGCGGAPFSSIDAPLPDGGSLGVTLGDAGVPGELDAGPGSDTGISGQDTGSTQLDAAPDHETTAADAEPPVDAAPLTDSSSPPACATEPPIPAGGACAAIDVVMPTSLCVDLESKSGSSTVALPTPAACASWCTFTCACLDTTTVCGTGTMTFCYADTGAHGLLHVTCND